MSLRDEILDAIQRFPFDDYGIGPVPVAEGGEPTDLANDLTDRIANVVTEHIRSDLRERAGLPSEEV